MTRLKKVDGKIVAYEPKPLNNQSLRTFAFALLAKREYSRHELQTRLLERAADPAQVEPLLDELVTSDYQNDERMAGMVVRSQIRQGRGPRRVQMALKKHAIDSTLAEDNVQSTNWLKLALDLKIRKFGENVATDAKQKAKQIRFLQYRGFDLDVILKVVNTAADEIETDE